MIIYCQKCKKNIGEIEIVKNVVHYKKLNGLLSSRLRFDRNWGFQCTCGNNSLLASVEKGIINSSLPTKNDLEEIEKRLKTKPTLITTKDQVVVCDGFAIKDK